MSISKRLRELLDAKQVKYVVITHSQAFTAQEIAASMHVPGREMAKTVVVKTPTGLALAVVRAMDKVDVDLVAAALGTADVRLATESEFRQHFADCEMGAMPPFGNLYDVPTVVDEQLAKDREIVFNAGSHVEAMRMAYADVVSLVQPRVARIVLMLSGSAR